LVRDSLRCQRPALEDRPTRGTSESPQYMIGIAASQQNHNRVVMVCQEKRNPVSNRAAQSLIEFRSVTNTALFGKWNKLAA
jgi:hypothetical protein